MNFHFAWPLIFCLLPLPWIVGLLFSATRRPTAAVKVPFFLEIKSISARTGTKITTNGRFAVLRVLWALLVIAAARPQIPDGMQSFTIPVRDVMLALDVSRSMEQKDMNQSGKTRLDVVKSAAVDFISMRKNERIGIVLFSEQANLYVPLTMDATTLKKMTEGVKTGLLGPLTAVGDALALSLQYLRESQAQRKVVVLLTDGLNNAGNVAPEDALTAAQKDGVTVYTIGVGSPSSKDSGIDTVFLNRVADVTGGLFFMAHDKTALDEAYRRISENEPESETEVFMIPQKELYFYPLLLFAAIASAFAFYRLYEQISYGFGGGRND